MKLLPSENVEVNRYTCFLKTLTKKYDLINNTHNNITSTK